MYEAFDFERLAKATAMVRAYVLQALEKTDPEPKFTTYVVWFSKTLQNWKALVSTTLNDGVYYEVTYNGDKKETYLDCYKKFHNVVWPDEADQPRNIPVWPEPITREFHQRRLEQS